MNGKTNLASIVIYRRYFINFKTATEQGVLDINTCNIALVGIAKDLKIMNPVLL